MAWLKRLQIWTGWSLCIINQMFIHLRCLYPVNFSCFYFVNQMFIVYYRDVYVDRKHKRVFLAGLLCIIKFECTKILSVVYTLHLSSHAFTFMEDSQSYSTPKCNIFTLSEKARTHLLWESSRDCWFVLLSSYKPGRTWPFFSHCKVYSQRQTRTCRAGRTVRTRGISTPPLSDPSSLLGVCYLGSLPCPWPDCLSAPAWLLAHLTELPAALSGPIKGRKWEQRRMT